MAVEVVESNGVEVEVEQPFFPPPQSCCCFFRRHRHPLHSFCRLDFSSGTERLNLRRRRRRRTGEKRSRSCWLRVEREIGRLRVFFKSAAKLTFFVEKKKDSSQNTVPVSQLATTAFADLSASRERDHRRRRPSTTGNRNACCRGRFGVRRQPRALDGRSERRRCGLCRRRCIPARSEAQDHSLCVALQPRRQMAHRRGESREGGAVELREEDQRGVSFFLSFLLFSTSTSTSNVADVSPSAGEGTTRISTRVFVPLLRLSSLISPQLRCSRPLRLLLERESDRRSVSHVGREIFSRKKAAVLQLG